MKTQVNGITLNYTDQGEGPPLLLVHAFPLSGAMWQPQVEALADTCRVIAPDLRGFGASDVPPGPYLMETFAADMAALLDRLDIEQVVVGGLSMGGYVALAFLRSYGVRVRGLILADTRATPDTDEARSGREINAQLAETDGSGAIADKMLPNLLAAEASPNVQATVRTLIEQTNHDGIAAALRGMALRPDSSDLLPSIEVPTLLLVGEHDSLTTPAEMQTMQQTIATSQLVTIPQAGHLANIENPTAFTSALHDFLVAL